MADLKAIKGRIKSINNTAKITHAMELVAAAKMKKAQELATAGKPYSALVNSVIRRIANKIDHETHPLLARTSDKKPLVILFSTDRGLAGALNSNLIKELDNIVGEAGFLTVGKKGRNFVVKSGKNLVADFPLPEKPDLESVRGISRFIIDSFLKKNFDQIHIVFTEYKSTIKQNAVLKQLLPIIDEKILEELSKEAALENLPDPLFEPDADEVLESILPQYVLMELYQIVLEAKASEHSARMVSMKNATDNAKDLAEDLTLTYNGIRQEVITKEILDISTAAIALE